MTDSRTRLDHWQRVWTTKPPEGVSWFQDEPAPSLAMIDAAGIAPPASVVDVGGGASRLVDRLLARGFSDLTVLDISAAALALARARLGAAGDRVAWVAADLLEWRPARRFDLWHDRAVFHFLTDPAEQGAYRRVLEGALAPGGVAILATFAPDGPEKCSGLTVARHDASTLCRALGASFALEDARAEEHHTPSGAVQRFNWFRVRRL